MISRNAHKKRCGGRRRQVWLPLVLLLVFLHIALYTGVTFAFSPLVEKLKDYPTAIKGEDIQVPLLLRAIGRQTGTNIFVADTIKGVITINMENLTLYDVFHVVMDAKKLSYLEKNNILFIEKKKDFESEKKDVVTVQLCTEYGNAASHLTDLNTLLGPDGRITVSNRGGCLIVTDRETNVDRIDQILMELDQPIPQVHIEAKIVFISQEAKHQLGVEWGYENYRDGTELASKSHTFTSSSDLSIAGSTDLLIGVIRDNLNLSIDLQALEEKSLLKILSAPRIMVLDGEEAEIKQGKQVPYVVQSGDMISTSFQEANLSLKVSPQILRQNYIILDVAVNNDSVDLASIGTTGEPMINTQEITTTLFLENSVTVVIGGILLETNENDRSSVPGLSGIPLLGNLFKNTKKRDDRSELLVFLTPKIVNMQTAAAHEDRNGQSSRRKVLARGKEAKKDRAAPLQVPDLGNMIKAVIGAP